MQTAMINKLVSPKLITKTLLVAPTTSLTIEFGQKVRTDIARTYPLMILATVLFDLLVKSEGMEFTAAELVEHVSTVTVDDLGLSEERCPALQDQPIPQVLFRLYEIMRELIWPEMKDHPIRIVTGSIQRINYEVLEVSFSRSAVFDGS